MANGLGEAVDLTAADHGASHSGPSRAAPLDVPRHAISNNQTKKVQQPKPQALPSRGQSSAILVNTRQKGNPVIQNIRGVPWEWADTPADYVLGQTTCALFLSLKYHRLHPEYIYTRIRELHGAFGLRIVLTMVDIPNHEESLKELSKTSLINNVTLILCWSAQEAGRYLELFKSYEHAAPTSIKAHQSTSYSDRLVDFITAPRSVNKTDAVNLVSTFGSLRTAVNASAEEISLVPGWGGKKVQRWCGSVREPFRVKKAARRGIGREDSGLTLSRDVSRPSLSRDMTKAEPSESGDGGVSERTAAILAAKPFKVPGSGTTTRQDSQDHGGDEENSTKAHFGNVVPTASSERKQSKANASKEPELSEGIAAALERLRNK